jgi:hypothetical protein
MQEELAQGCGHNEGLLAAQTQNLGRKAGRTPQGLDGRRVKRLWFDDELALHSAVA